MTWIDEAASLGTSGVVAAILYWLGRRVASHLEDVLKEVLRVLTIILGKLENVEHLARLDDLTRPTYPTPAAVPKPPAK